MTAKPSASVDHSYEVGYGKPPQASRFTKGQSGNAKGRPKGSRNALDQLVATLMEPITINENGKRKQVPKLVAAGKHLANKAASGDAAAMRLMLQLMRNDVSKATSDGSAIKPSAAVLETLIQRISNSVIPEVTSPGQKEEG